GLTGDYSTKAKSAPREALNKSILDFSALAIGKAWFSGGSQDQQLTAADLGSTSLRCGKR
ncbi:MAG: hypothetical protein WBV19_07565, partial [Candidatus Macondimonas sp.]